MKPTNGTFEIHANGVDNPEDTTVITAKIVGDRLYMGCETYEWAAGFDMFVGEHVDATVRFTGSQNAGTIEGSTGVPPNQRRFTGTYVRK